MLSNLSKLSKLSRQHREENDFVELSRIILAYIKKPFCEEYCFVSSIAFSKDARRETSDVVRQVLHIVVQTSLKQRFWGPISTTRRASWVLHEFYTHYNYHQMVTQQRPKGPRGLSEINQKLQFFGHQITA